MKCQYLGDSKDSFKWDYLDFVVQFLALPQLRIAWMMTPDDSGSDGDTKPELFPARPEIVEFCKSLITTRNPEQLVELPAATGAHYSVAFHKAKWDFSRCDRNSYFTGFDYGTENLLFLDPDNGFEPEKSHSKKHVLYTDIDRIIKSISHHSIVTIFQHFRRVSFPNDFAHIRNQLLSGHSCAVYSGHLMFVNVSSSLQTIRKVAKTNEQYARNINEQNPIRKPVKTIG